MENSGTPKRSLWRSLKSVRQNPDTLIEGVSASTVLDSTFSTTSMNNDNADDNQSINSLASTINKSKKLRDNFSRFSSKLTRTNSSSASPASVSSNSSNSPTASSFSSTISNFSFSSSASSSQIPNIHHKNFFKSENISNYGKTGSHSLATFDSNATIVSRKEKMISSLENINQCNDQNKENKKTCENTSERSYAYEIPNRTLNPALIPVRKLNNNNPLSLQSLCINDQTVNFNDVSSTDRTSTSSMQRDTVNITKRYSTLVPNITSDCNDYSPNISNDLDDLDEDYLKFKEDLSFDVSIDEDKNEDSKSSLSTMKYVAAVSKDVEKVNNNNSEAAELSPKTESKYGISMEATDNSMLEQATTNTAVNNDESLLMKSAFDDYQLVLEALSISEPDNVTTSRHVTSNTSIRQTIISLESGQGHDTLSSGVLSSFASYPSTPKSLTPVPTKSDTCSSLLTLPSSTLSHSKCLLKNFLMLGGNLSNIEDFANVEINDYAGVIVVGPPMVYDNQIDNKHSLFKNEPDTDLSIRINNEIDNILGPEHIFDYESNEISETDMKFKQGINKTSFNRVNGELSSKQLKKVQRTALHFC
ncbi:hypothetical protein BVG19_g5062 [[Candida] boidinii]|nr:hypothetical protein BVG19_g5062 [[Candida] boidinii]OWB52554.1 hypothetical protein B5S27_g4131 [[Candida] boidinii]